MPSTLQIDSAIGEAMSFIAPTPAFRRHSPRIDGFGLVELIVTIAIAAILAAIALPSFRELMVRMNTTAITNDLVGALNTARVEAVKRGIPVAVVSNGNWTDGWEIKADTARDGSYGTMIMQHPAVPNTYSILGVAGTGGDDAMAAFGPGGTLQIGTRFDFSICRPASSANQTQSRWIFVRGSGEVTSQRDVTNSPAGTCS